jgi:hypothetical protein
MACALLHAGRRLDVAVLITEGQVVRTVLADGHIHFRLQRQPSARGDPDQRVRFPVLPFAPRDMSRFACGYCGAALAVERRGGTIALRQVVDAVARVQVGTDKTAAELAIARPAAPCRWQRASAACATARPAPCASSTATRSISSPRIRACSWLAWTVKERTMMRAIGEDRSGRGERTPTALGLAYSPAGAGAPETGKP